MTDAYKDACVAAVEAELRFKTVRSNWINHRTGEWQYNTALELKRKAWRKVRDLMPEKTRNSVMNVPGRF